MIDSNPSLHLSIHDVTPDTLDRVTALSQRLMRHGFPPAALLVVPGLGWRGADLARLTRLADAGHPLVGHGWIHRAERIRGVRHRLYAHLVSGQSAEHLGLSDHGIAALIHGCHAWFGAHDLPVPDYYVPPAWAMGNISRRELAALPFRYYEFIHGVYDTRRDRFAAMPVVGFEARGGAQAAALRLWNRFNHWAVPWMGTLRIAIHPDDEVLALENDLGRALEYWSGRAAPVGDRVPV